MRSVTEAGASQMRTMIGGGALRRPLARAARECASTTARMAFFSSSNSLLHALQLSSCAAAAVRRALYRSTRSLRRITLEVCFKLPEPHPQPRPAQESPAWLGA
jgi:hypothetical protein